MITPLDNYKATTKALSDLVLFFTKSYNALDHLPAWVWDESRGGIDFSKYALLLEQARSEIEDFEKRQSALDSRIMEDIESEDYILTHSALRIDGYEYRERTDLNSRFILDTFYKTNTFEHTTPLDKLACFFLLQRGLCKWGGEMLARNSPEWKAYRTLFIDTIHVEVPAQFRPPTERSDKWEYRIKPRILDCIEIVRRIHEQTKYTEHATLQPPHDA